MTPAPAQRVRPRPALFRALGRDEPPDAIEVAGRSWRRDCVLKHDSWAATALYRADGEALICKFNRVQPVGIVPMRWLGRLLARREAGFFDRLKDLALVPDGLGQVTAGGRILDNAAARVFVEGEAFRDREQIAPAFLDELRALIEAMHARGMAYVDLHKRENVIVGRDGRPHLIDFQVSFGLGAHWPGNGRIARALLALLQEMDLYHWRKHYARLFPERLTPEQRAAYERPPAFIRAHRRVAVPLRTLRRALLSRLRIRDRSGMARSEFEPEIAFREEAERGPKA